MAKIVLFTKLAGNFKKLDQFDECLKNSKAAHELSKQLIGELDIQTCKSYLNLADVYVHFEKKEEAIEHFTYFTTLFAKQDGTDGKQDWSAIQTFVKLKEFAEGRLAELTGEEGGEEYYDEEEDGGEAG